MSGIYLFVGAMLDYNALADSDNVQGYQALFFSDFTNVFYSSSWRELLHVSRKQSASNVKWGSLGLLLKCIFCYFSRPSAFFKCQLLTLIRIELLNINFNVGSNNC